MSEPCKRCAHYDEPPWTEPCLDCVQPGNQYANFREPVVPLTVQVEALNATGGGKLTGAHYYRVEVPAPMSPELQPYSAECADIIEALDMTFNEGEAFKAIWRLAAARQGRVKSTGAGPQYDADKVAHYGARVAAQTRAR